MSSVVICVISDREVRGRESVAVCSEKAGAWSDLGREEDREYEARIAKQDVKLCHCKECLADKIDYDSERMTMRDGHDRKSHVFPGTLFKNSR